MAGDLLQGAAEDLHAGGARLLPVPKLADIRVGGIRAARFDGGEDLDLPAERGDLLAQHGEPVERPFQLGKEQVGLIHGEEFSNSLHRRLN